MSNIVHVVTPEEEEALILPVAEEVARLSGSLFLLLGNKKALAETYASNAMYMDNEIAAIMSRQSALLAELQKLARRQRDRREA
jgi:hypothetical protein